MTTGAKIAVRPHVRGLTVSIIRGIRPSELADRLRRLASPDPVFRIDRNFVVPSRVAPGLAGEFGDSVVWEEGTAALAEDLKERQDRARAGKVGAMQAMADPLVALAGFDLLDRLDQHQQAAVAAMTVPTLPGMALFDEQGVGKTIAALAGFHRLRQLGLIMRLLVVAPKSVQTAWMDDSHKMFGSAYRVVPVSGAADDRRRQIRARHDVLIVSYDGLVRDFWSLRTAVSAVPKTYMLAVDESYFVKNPETLRSKRLVELRPYFERAIVLCGTPAPHSARDIVNQVELADGGVAFRGQHAPDDETAARLFVEQGLQQTFYLRRLKEEVLPGLPIKQLEVVRVHLQPVQQKLYSDALHGLIEDVAAADDASFRRNLATFLARRMALLRICSHPGAVLDTYGETPAKLLALDALVEEIVVIAGLKVVIWSFFTYSLRRIRERYSHHGLVVIDGSVTSAEDRRRAIHAFQKDPRVRIFLGNPAAAGAGITLTAAHHAIYESLSNQGAHWLQSVDRIHRRGQVADVVNHVLVADGTLEEQELDRLRQKELSARELLRDDYDEPPTRERFLAQLEWSMQHGAASA